MEIYRTSRSIFWVLTKVIITLPVMFVGALVFFHDEEEGTKIVDWLVKLGQYKK